jgi:type I restriction enzyme R subunit
VQLFVISNGTLTKYYSNTVRDGSTWRAAPGAGSARRPTASSSPLVGRREEPADHRLVGFTKTFFAKHTLLNVLTRYCVLDVDRKLLVMRPYQIVADRAHPATHRDRHQPQAARHVAAGATSGTPPGRQDADQLQGRAAGASPMPDVDKVLFVVDRKDLDYQTMREYDRFEKGAANSNTSTAVLQRSSWKTRTRASSSRRSRSSPASSPGTRATPSTTGTSW